MYWPQNPTVAFSESNPLKIENYDHTKIHTQLFTGVLFIIANTWKQPKGPTIGEWLNCGTSIPQTTTHQQKWASYCYVQLGWNFRTLGWLTKPTPKDHMFYDSIYVTFWKWQNYSDGEEISDCQRLRIGGGQRGSSVWMYDSLSIHWWKLKIFSIFFHEKCFENYSVYLFFNQRLQFNG